MIQQVIVIVIGIAVAAYVVYHVVRMAKGKVSSCPSGCCGCASASCCSYEIKRRGVSKKMSRKNRSLFAESEKTPIFAAQ